MKIKQLPAVIEKKNMNGQVYRYFLRMYKTENGSYILEYVANRRGNEYQLFKAWGKDFDKQCEKMLGMIKK